MAIILGSCFFGLSVLASHLKPIPQEDGETVLSLMGGAVFGGSSVMYYVLQFSTFAILILAANTAYADFPRLSSIVAARRLPAPPAAEPGRPARVLQRRSSSSPPWPAVLIIVFGGDTSALIPLYAVGVFTGFTLSPDRHGRAPLAAPGAALEGWAGHQRGRRHHDLIVLLVVVVSKFTIGAWIPVVVIPLFVLILSSIGRHYRKVHDAGRGARRLEAAALPAQRRAPREQRQPGRRWRP